MPKKTRRKFTAEQKAAVVRRHLVDKVPVSNLCDEYGIQPSMFYNWQKVLVDNAARAFDGDTVDRTRPSREAELEQKIALLEAKLARKDNIIAEISEEYVTLKKEIGEP
jgi:transposase-like protein